MGVSALVSGEQLGHNDCQASYRGSAIFMDHMSCAAHLWSDGQSAEEASEGLWAFRKSCRLSC